MMKLNYKTMFAAGVSLLVGGLAMAQSVDLTVKWKPDHHYEMKQSVVVGMTTPSSQGDGEIATKMKMATAMGGASSIDPRGLRIDMKFDAVSMSMAVAGNVVMRYDSSKPDPENPMDKTMAPLNELKFAPIFGDDGQLIELTDFDENLVTPQMGITMGSLEKLIKQQTQMVPSREVKVDEIWKSRISTSLQGHENGLMCNYSFKLASVEEKDGKQVARVEFTAEMEKVRVVQNRVDMLLSAKSMEGYYLFDVTEGQFIESKSSFDMVADVQGLEMQMKTETKVKFDHRPLDK